MAVGVDDGLHTVAQVEFGEDAGDVGLDGLLADHEVCGDLARSRRSRRGGHRRGMDASAVQSGCESVQDDAEVPFEPRVAVVVVVRGLFDQ
jgi:hypothetical protein